MLNRTKLQGVKTSPGIFEWLTTVTTFSRILFACRILTFLIFHAHKSRYDLSFPRLTLEHCKFLQFQSAYGVFQFPARLYYAECHNFWSKCFKSREVCVVSGTMSLPMRTIRKIIRSDHITSRSQSFSGLRSRFLSQFNYASSL